MDDDNIELLRHLFATMSAFIETAHEVAIKGQAGHLTVQEYADIAHRLEAAARQISTLSEAASVIAGQSAE